MSVGIAGSGTAPIQVMVGAVCYGYPVDKGRAGRSGGGLVRSPFSKERLDSGNGTHLGVACDGREVCKSTGEDGEIMSDAVGRRVRDG